MIKKKCSVFLISLSFLIGSCTTSPPPISDSGESFAELAPIRTLMEMNRYDIDTYLLPFWYTREIYQETVLFLESEIQAPLLYEAQDILSVKNYGLNISYEEGKDYIVSNGKLCLTENSTIPRFALDEYYLVRPDDKVIKVDKSKVPFELEGERWLNFFEGNEITDKQISVCYRHKQRWEGPVPAGKEEKLKNLLAKINGKEEITVLFYGDSITTGAQSSAFEQISPKADIWPVMVCKYLEKECGIRVNYINEAVGGYTTNQGAQNFEASVNRKGVDLLVLAFGMNDKNTNGGRYKSLIQEMAESFHKKNPSGEVLLVSTMTPNYETDWYGNQVQFADELIGLESEYDYCACADITNIFEYLFEAGKRFRDVTVNNVNHPNDFGARLYAQVILKTILGDKFEERYDAVKG